MFWLLYFQAHMALTPYRACLPGSWRSQTLKGKCRALWTAAVIQACFLCSQQNPYSSRRLPRDAAALKRAISNRQWSTQPGSVSRLQHLPLHQLLLWLRAIFVMLSTAWLMFWVPSTYPQHQVPEDALLLGVICCIPHTRGPRCPPYLDIGLFQVCDDIVWAPWSSVMSAPIQSQDSKTETHTQGE